MSVSICDVEIPAEYCPPVMLHVAAAVAKLKRELDMTKQELQNLKSKLSLDLFIEECFVRKEGGVLRRMDAYGRYKCWCVFNPSIVIVSKDTLFQKLKMLYGEPGGPKSDTWNGVELKDE